MESVLLQVLQDMQRGSGQMVVGQYSPEGDAPPSIRAIKYRVSAQLSSSVVPGMREHVLGSMVERLRQRTRTSGLGSVPSDARAAAGAALEPPQAPVWRNDSHHSGAMHSRQDPPTTSQ